jgi:ubiquinone/menaquinone biosynthesis C-methylase UbiE
MNASHSKLTDWGLSHVSIKDSDTILDVGCGGGRTVGKLAAFVTHGKVYGIDYSDASVSASKRTNAPWIDVGRAEILLGSVSQLPFSDDMFDLVTAVETHFWWPDLPNDLREVFRVIKPGGTVILIAEVYKGAGTMMSRLAEKSSAKIGLNLLTADEHRELLTIAGCCDIQIDTKPAIAWICAIGKKPLTSL